MGGGFETAWPATIASQGGTQGQGSDRPEFKIGHCRVAGHAAHPAHDRRDECAPIRLKARTSRSKTPKGTSA